MESSSVKTVGSIGNDMYWVNTLSVLTDGDPGIGINENWTVTT